MQELPRRTGFSGPKLIRLLARLTDAEVPESRQSPSDRLSLWLGWTDAIALSTALNRAPVSAPAGARPEEGAGAQESARVRASLEQAIAGPKPTAGSRQRGDLRAPPQDKSKAAEYAEWATYRQRYMSLQQTMEMSIGTLRIRLRAMLAASTPEMTQLAVLDAVMEQGLSARERSLLAGVPKLLEGHFTRLREAEQAALADAAAAPEGDAAVRPLLVAPGTWLEVFRKDMQTILHAELDIRFQPIEGLLAALRDC